MNRTLIIPSALLAGLASVAVAQTAAPAAGTTAPAPTAASPAVAPQAVPAKVALIAFEQSVFATNEGQRAVQDVQTKYAPRKSQIDALASEVDSLKKQLQGAPQTLSDDEKQNRLKNIDTKEKQLTRDAEDAQQAYNTDLQEAYAKVAQKVSVTAKNYCQQGGFTLLLDVSNQTSNVMWANSSSDVTQAVVESYNRSSGIAAPPPSAPSAGRPMTGATTAPRSTTPRPAATH